MNILIITDLPFEKELFGENEVLRSLLTDYSEALSSVLKELSEKGHNILLARPDFCKNSKPSFSFSEEGFSVLSVKLLGKSRLALSDFKRFNEVLFNNAESLSGLFRPEAVILAEVFPFGAKAAAKIAGLFGGVYINLCFCDPFEGAKMLKSRGLSLLSLKAEFIRAQKEAGASLGFFPNAQKLLNKSKRFYPMYLPVKKSKTSPTADAVSYRNMLSSFNEGNGFSLVFASPLVKGSGAFEAVSLFADAERVSLVFMESGAQKEVLRKFVSEKGVKNVFFLDEPPEDELSFVLGGAKALVLTENSLLKGNFAEQIPFIKAASSGVPIIASSRFNADFFRETGGSIIIKPHNKESFRLGIKALLEMSTEDRSTLGESLLNFTENHSPEKFAGDLMNLIDSLRK